MGMDVYGKNPANKTGEYFRRNVWGWHPLWDYVENQHPEIAELVENAHTNDGDGLGKKKSILLAELLKADVTSGKVADYVEARNRELSELPFTECDLCNSTGIRTDDVAVEAGFPDKVLPEDIAIIVGRKKGYCNGCNGVGKREPFETWYSLYESDVQEFAEFLESCGGFEIC